MLELNNLDARGIGHIERRDDARQALQVVGVVGDDQGIGARVDVDRVVGANEGPQNGHQIVGVFVIKLKNLGHDLAIRGGHRASRHAATLKLGIGLRHHQIKPSRLHQGIALGAQLSGKQTECLRRRHRHIAGQCDGAFDARIDHHVVARQGGQGFGHGIDVGIVEVERDGLCR